MPDQPLPTDGTYLVPDSDSRIMDSSELDGLDAYTIRLIANEIYARHGYTFRNEEYLNYFSQKSWYQPTISADDFSDDMLNSVEQANVTMIYNYEIEHGYR